MQSLPVADLAAERLAAEASGEEVDPTSLLSGLSVEVTPNSDILVISYRDPDPVEAQRRAQAFAISYLEFRRLRAAENIEVTAQTLRARIADLTTRLQEINEALAETADVDNDPNRPILQSEAAAIISELPALRQQLASLVTRETLQVGEVLEPASIPTSPASPNHFQNAILGLLGGAALGVAVAFLREQLDDRFRGRSDLETRIDAPVLAVIPNAPTWRKRETTPLLALDEPRTGTSEAYRTLRTGLLFLAAQQGARSILVTSAQAGEGKTATVANLGVVLAQAGNRVILISADLRKPRLHRFFDTDNAPPGLSGVLAGQADPWDVLVRPKQDALVRNVRILPSGPVPPNPSELIGSEAMASSIKYLTDVADLVIIDAPPILVVSDVVALSPLVDAVLLVADAGSTTRAALAHAREQLEHVDANVIGAVLNNFDPARSPVSPYSYRYYYSYASRYYEQAEESDGESKQVLRST